MTASSLTARLIAEMISADMISARSWRTPHLCSDHPILGPAIAHRNARYSEIRRSAEYDVTEARIVANAEAIDMIIAMVLRSEVSA